MEQELASLRARFEEQGTRVSSLTDNIARLNNAAATRAATAPAATEGSHEEVDSQKRRFSNLEWETSELRLSVEGINENLARRAAAEQEVREGLARVQEAVRVFRSSVPQGHPPGDPMEQGTTRSFSPARRGSKT